MENFMICSSIFIIITNICVIHPLYSEIQSFHDDGHLTPYIRTHGSRLNYRAVKECHPVEFGNVPHEHYPAHKPSHTPSEKLVNTKYFSRKKDNVLMYQSLKGHVSIVSDPLRTVSVLEPGGVGGCAQKVQRTVAATSLQKQCLIAVNAGYFNTHTGACLGNIVSDGNKVQDSGGIQNAHFGIKKNGSLFFGYISEEEISDGPGDFAQLIGGVVWLLRNGTSFVNTSKFLECENTEETGRMDYFVDVRSARTAVGHDEEGRLVIVQVDGKTDLEGASLWEMAELMKTFGAINAINLDGGGSSTFVINGTIVNYPSDDCEDRQFKCARNVTTVLCVHNPECDPPDCNGRGVCTSGECTCDPEWEPPSCNSSSCIRHNCSDHGRCTEDGCLCDAGWTGTNCSRRCPANTYGYNCTKSCDCISANSLFCDAVTGFCHCKPGFAGRYCHLNCPFGFFGMNCSQKCVCNGTCGCDSITGFCYERGGINVPAEAQCYAQQLISQNLSSTSNCRSWSLLVIAISVIGGLSIIGGGILIFWYYKYRRNSLSRSPTSRRQWQKIPSDSQDDVSEEIAMNSVTPNHSVNSGGDKL